MAEIKTSFKGVEKLPKLAARIQAIKRFRELVKPIVEEWQDETLPIAQKYPPPPPGSKYVRTFKLQRSWHKSPIGGGVAQVRASVYSDGTADAGYGDYAPYVMGRYKQASIHQGRWKTDQMIADETKTGVTRKIRVAAKRALENIVP